MPYARSKCGSARSTVSLVSPYALIGRVGWSSVIGTRSGSPNTAAVDEKMKRPTPLGAIASSTASVPTTLLR